MIGTYQIYNGEIKTLRNEGYSLRLIGDKFGVSRERIRQILNQHYGTIVRSGFVSRNKLSKLLKCAEFTLRKLEQEGTLNPKHMGGNYLYDRDESEKAALEIYRLPHNRPDLERICQECGKIFRVRPWQIRKRYTRTLCSKPCTGRHLGKSNTGSHRKHVGKRKWDYDLIYQLRQETGWGACRIGRKLRIPESTISVILRREKEVK